MSRLRWAAFVPLLALACGLGAAVYWWSGRGVSARDTPTQLEAWLAGQLRALAIPRSAREMRNPLTATPAVLADARRHFADHCATCHGNDGSGHTPIGQNLYPKAPDMRLPATQNLTDGELYYDVPNGGFSGMMSSCSMVMDGQATMSDDGHTMTGTYTGTIAGMMSMSQMPSCGGAMNNGSFTLTR